MIKLIATDMDGTLLNSKNEIQDGFYEVFNKLEEKGIIFVISTGREYENVKYLLDKQNIKCQCILSNGAEYRDEMGNILDVININEKSSRKILKILKENNISARMFTNKGIYTTATKEEALLEVTFRTLAFDPHLTKEEAKKIAEKEKFFTCLKYIDDFEKFFEEGIEIRKFVAFHEDIKLIEKLKKIIGEIEGHFIGNPQKKSTKYEHIIPLLYSVEESDEIKGILVILNTVGGDVEAGLAMAELINSISKKVVTLVLGGSHSIGVPLATAGDYSYIAPSATMIVHPIRTNGLVIGINESFEYFKKMQERIDEFITRTSNIEREKLSELMHAKDELITDVGSVLIGKEAVECGLINEVGGLKEALTKLRELIKNEQNEGNK